MKRHRRKFIWISVILELGLMMGVIFYLFNHRSLMADESLPQIELSEQNTEEQTVSLMEDIQQPKAIEVTKPIEIEKAQQKQELTPEPTNVGGPYTVSPTYHMSIYHAKKGDNLASIAKKNDLDFFTILSINGLKSSNDISIGQRLRIPNQRGIVHEIKKGQSLEDISLMYNVNLRKIIRVNQILDPSGIEAGTELFIPGARTTVDFQKTLLEQSGIYQEKKVLEVKTREIKSKIAVNPRSRSRSSSSKSRSKSSQSESLIASSYKGQKVNSNFGYRRDPFTGRREFHAGVDIGMKYGSSVSAAIEGVVTYAGWMGGYGKLVVITNSDGISTRYGHLSRITVKNGSRISQGQRIGTVGSTGRSTGAHLHFEVRKDDKPLNPTKFISGTKLVEEPDDEQDSKTKSKAVSKSSKSSRKSKSSKTSKSRKR